MKKEKENKETKDRIITNIRTLFEEEEGYNKPKRISNFCNNNYINRKVMVIELKTYH